MKDQQQKTFFEKYKEYAKEKYGDLTKEEFLKHYKEYIKEHKAELTEQRKGLMEKYGLNKETVVDEAEIIQNGIKRHQWFHFGKKPFDCIGFEKAKGYYVKNSQLPKPCDECYKALIFWNSLAENNMINFYKMIKSFDFDYDGKLNNGVIVFYFRHKDEALEFVELLKKK